MNDFPDYEASRVVARRLLQEYVSFMAEMANPGNRYVTGEMVTKGNERILRLMDEAVDAALSDKVLYEKIKAFQPRMCGHRYDYVQMWPKENNDE